MEIKEAYDEYLWAIKRLSPETQRGYKVKLGVLIRWCESQNPAVTLEALNRKVLRSFFDDLAQHTRPATQQSYARTIRAFLFWCSKEEGIEELVPETTARRMEMPRGQSRVLEVFTKDDVRLLLKATESEKNKELCARGRAIIEVLYGTGIRAAELCGLTLDNCTLTPDVSHIKVYGKGQKQRVVPLEGTAVTALRAYIKRFRTDKPGENHVFLSERGTGLSITGLEQIVYRLARKAGLRGEARVRCSPHTFRHTYAVVSLLRGVDIYKIKLRMGHSSVTVTENYLKALDAISARGAESLYV